MDKGGNITISMADEYGNNVPNKPSSNKGCPVTISPVAESIICSSSNGNGGKLSRPPSENTLGKRNKVCPPAKYKVVNTSDKSNATSTTTENSSTSKTDWDLINIGVQKIANGLIQIFYGLIALDMFSKFMINPNIIVAGIMFIFNVAAAFTVGFGVSRCLEGAQDIKNSADGRTDIVSINVYRDVIFQLSGNKELYDNIEFIALALTILGIMTGPALNDYGYTHPTKPIEVTQNSLNIK